MDSGHDETDLGGHMIIKLARLVRLQRFQVSRKLKMTIQGVFVGLRVIGWAVVCSSSLSTLLAWLQDPDMLELFDDLDIGTANKTGSLTSLMLI